MSRIRITNGACNEMNCKTGAGSDMENILLGSVWLYLLENGEVKLKRIERETYVLMTPGYITQLQFHVIPFI
jgi:hypothetical protein